MTATVPRGAGGSCFSAEQSSQQAAGSGSWPFAGTLAGPRPFLETQPGSVCRSRASPARWVPRDSGAWSCFCLLSVAGALASPMSLPPRLAQAPGRGSSDLCPQNSALGLKTHFGRAQALLVLTWVVASSQGALPCSLHVTPVVGGVTSRTQVILVTLGCRPCDGSPCEWSGLVG